MTVDKQTEIEAAVFRRLLKHLDSRKDVQNIDLMNLAGFCRNCFSKWTVAEAEKLGETIDIDTAREQVYGMSYSEWKEKHQLPATAEQLAIFEQLSKK
ncbi:deoxycytidine triphosphate deaminase [Thalassotalea sp. 42_200_T64]|nr:deoxycytidine triphosphate deaminase [Thalassotalea sp. 42_200_T64]